jgi:hypothetical protein
MKFAQLFLLIVLMTYNAIGQTIPNNSKALDKQDFWTQKDLIQPAELAALIRNPKSNPIYIFNIGVVEDIKGAKKLGEASKKENLEKLNAALKAIPKSSRIVIYCGCCPFDKCPNIRPAFNLMKNSGYSNGKLLNIPLNLKQDWISKGYPLNPKRRTS